MAHVKDMTKGRPAGLILGFALPLMLGNICQQAYTLVDTAVVGQFVGVEALAALGASDWLNWMVLGIGTGMTQGFGILMAQCFGAEDQDGLRQSVGHGIWLSAVIAVLVTLFAHLSLNGILGLLQTPQSILPGATLYLRVLYSGIPIVMAYNLLASLLRALGDGRSPLFAMLIASAVNIVLDLVFVLVFHWGIAGAAAATLIGQGVSVLYCFLVVRKLSFLRLSAADFKPSWTRVWHMLRLGAPIAAQNTIISIGGLIVQSVVNGFGFLFVAGFTATNKLYGLLELAAISFGYSISTYTGQNLGAKQFGRIRGGVRASVGMALLTSAVIGGLMLLLGRYILMLFVSGEAGEVTQVLDIAYTYLFVMASCLPILYMLYVYRSALQGMGNTFMPLMSGIIEFAMRVGAALLLPHFMGQNGIYLAEVAAWTGAAVLLALSYYRSMRGLPKQDMERAALEAEKA